jgi:hypothetical protein
MRALEGKVPGIAVAYHALCEFLHPNIGDYFSSVMATSKSSDFAGATHIEVLLGKGPTDLRESPDVDIAVGQAIQTVVQVITLLPELDNEMKNTASRLSWRTQKLIRPLIRRNRDLFSLTDPCPCHSGRSIASCCNK